jgi:hypothetical protein
MRKLFCETKMTHTNRQKTAHRYAREHRLALALKRELKAYGIASHAVGFSQLEKCARPHPVNLVIGRRVLALVRIEGQLTAADRLWLARWPLTLVLSAPSDVLGALPGIRGALATLPEHELAHGLCYVHRHSRLNID